MSIQGDISIAVIDNYSIPKVFISLSFIPHSAASENNSSRMNGPHRFTFLSIQIQCRMFANHLRDRVDSFVEKASTGAVVFLDSVTRSELYLPRNGARRSCETE